MSGTPLPVPPAPRRRLRRPALLALVIVLTVIGGIVASQILWQDLRSSMTRMDETLLHARERQREMIEQFAEAQSLLLEQQRHFQQIEADLKAREAVLRAERVALERAQAQTQARMNERTQGLMLAQRLDQALSDIAEPAGRARLGEVIDALSGWATAAETAIGSAQHTALLDAIAAARARLETASDTGPERLTERLLALSADIADLPLAPARRLVPDPRRAGRQLGPTELRSQLQTALFALQRGDQALFDLALDTAAAWLQAFYDPSSPKVQALGRDLAELKGSRPRADLGELTSAATHLRALLGELLDMGAASEPRALGAGGG